jgi:hypothetical protein
MASSSRYGDLIDESVLYGDLLDLDFDDLSDAEVEELFGMLGIFRMLLNLDRRIEDIMETWDKLQSEGKGEWRIKHLAKNLFRNVKKKMKKEPGWEPDDDMIDLMEEGEIDFDSYMEEAIAKADAAEASSSSADEVRALKAELAKLKAKEAETVSGLLPDVSLRTTKEPTAVQLMLQHRYGKVR